MEIKYRIEFHTDWHCGSGLAAGADVDALVVTDANGLPYVPGKTIKGLVREAMLETNSETDLDERVLDKLFGTECKDDCGNQGCLFFSNAELSRSEKEEIVRNKAQKYLFRSIASTALDENGVAKRHSLRKIQVTVPCTMEGCILNIPDDTAALIGNSLRYIKRLGQNRNRGLGRCTIKMEETK